MSPDQPTTPPGELRYKRVLLKLSGEALMGDEGYGISPETLHRFAGEIQAVRTLGADLAIVVGGGNIFRGAAAEDRGLDRVAGDHMGMLATLINSLALQDVLERCGLETRVLSALEIREVAEPFIRRRALRHLERGRVVILAAGTGNPYFTTDSAAALRAMELRADVLLKATQVDGIYTADPKTDSTATFIKRLRYLEVLERGLRVMDTTAISLCMDNEMPIVVFDVWKRGNISAVVRGEDVGSLVTA